MKQLVVLFLENVSSKKHFQFNIRCDKCGLIISSPPVHFSKADITPENQSKEIIYNALYTQEMEQARQKAVRQLAHQFNRCPLCQKLVCNHCFLICEDLDICSECAASLQEKGVPVL